MNINKNELIKRFLNEVQNKYPSLYISCNYDKEDDLYEIWHNDPNLEYKDNEFKKIVASKAQEILFNNDIFNFYFGYDHFKAIKLENNSILLYLIKGDLCSLNYI